jgi:folate-binding protein YgfZ
MPSGADEYLGHRLRAGVPEGIDFGSDKMFALDAGLEELHGVSFEKGCYVGQELTARMKHRGTARKRLLPILSMTGANLAAPGAEIRIGPQVIGEITSTYGDQGFGLVRLDRWREAGAAEGLAGDQPIAIQSPAWLHLDA